MKRREFLSMAAAAGASLSMPRAFGAELANGGVASKLDAGATAADSGKLLFMIELKGGNDGLNTVIPYADSTYYALREQIAIPRNRVLALDARTALHPSLNALLPLWRDGQLAIVQGVGSVGDDTSHFRSRQIWDTASRADAYQRDGWLTRALDQCARRGRNVATASFGCVEAGPFVRSTPERATADSWMHVDDPDDAVAEHADDDPVSRVASHAAGLSRIEAPTFRASIDTALRTAVDTSLRHDHRAIRLTLDGFDTHSNQPARHAALLAQLAEGCAILRAELERRGRWRDTLIVTYSEFGRSARENSKRGTEHGGGAAHFVAGGLVRGGLYGRTPDFARIDADGRLLVDVDFRRLYATVLGAFWKLDVKRILQDDVEPLPLLRA
jgi:uncharacterized protein (DUF1501 family)